MRYELRVPAPEGKHFTGRFEVGDLKAQHLGSLHLVIEDGWCWAAQVPDRLDAEAMPAGPPEFFPELAG